MDLKKSCWAAGFILLAGLASPAQAGFSDEGLADFADEVSERHGLERARVQAFVEGAVFQQDIIDAISSPAEARPWREYRPIFLTESRIEEGVEFWDAHTDKVDEAAEAFGVAPEVLVAILGVETRYGQHAGRHRVLDALATLAFGYPPRADFFRSELEQFLLLVEEEGLEPEGLKGSYAGAMGLPQFISSSYRHYAVDFDGDGQRNLFENKADILGSVANYFSEHGWRTGEPVAVRAEVSGEAWAELTSPNRGPARTRHTMAELSAAGVTPASDVADDTPVALLELEGEEGPEYWVTFHNFYVITRYNHSALYGLAVYQLAEAIREGRDT